MLSELMVGTAVINIIIIIILVIDPIGRSLATLPVIKASSPRNTRDYASPPTTD